MLNVGGKQVAIQARLGLGPSAPRIIAAAIYMNPQVRAAVGIASLLGTAKLIYDEADRQWKKSGSASDVISDGFEYMVSPSNIWTSDPTSACMAAIPYRATQPGNWSVKEVIYSGAIPLSCVMKSINESESIGDFPLGRRASTSCPAGWTITPAGCTSGSQPVPVTQQEMVELLNPDNHVGWPTSVPNELPLGTPLPVQLPVVNPSTGVNPFPKPLFVPTGDPVKNPNYDPSKPQTADNQPFIQPGVNVTPRPTTANPWQVDIQPVERPQSGADPLPDEQQNPDTDPDDKPKEEDSKSLCEKHPDILACSKPDLDTPDGEIPRLNLDVSLQEENLFGGGACPADIYFAPHGLQQMKVWDWNKACGDITTYLKPILLICCTFAAFMILVPGRTE
ncbi:IgG-binding virulence factor TspB family protein [Pantoea sp. 18069]|uniref:IgG-binding virulence factor TspB family protein n=1 Tax=Pantoea sp. 18069 TaxID=2681415 RepID=UPI001356D5BC|nr:IgG-binding virulence factor TspB family protein [Pantoea sp. 18069]